MNQLGIGSFVRYNCPDPHGEHFAIGRVVSIERYTDDQGTRVWYGVQWITENGGPAGEPKKHSEDELKVIP